MRKNPHVRICGGLGSATTLVYPTPFSRGVMVVLGNVIKPQGLEPLQFPTKFRAPSFQRVMADYRARQAADLAA